MRNQFVAGSYVKLGYGSIGSKSGVHVTVPVPSSKLNVPKLLRSVTDNVTESPEKKS